MPIDESAVPGIRIDRGHIVPSKKQKRGQ